MWKNQLLPEFAQHFLTVVRFAEPYRRHAENASQVSAECLGRGVIQLPCHTRDREPGILQQSCCSNQTSNVDITLGRRQVRTIEPTHQCTRNNVEVTSHLTNVGDVGLVREKQLEKLPAIGCYSGKIQIQRSQHLTLYIGRSLMGQQIPQRRPAGRRACIDQGSDTYSTQFEN